MIKVSHAPIPKKYIKEFLRILSDTGSKLTKNPYIYGDVYKVDYIIDDYTELSKRYARLTTPIKEKNKTQKWRIFLRKLKINV